MQPPGAPVAGAAGGGGSGGGGSAAAVEAAKSLDVLLGCSVRHVVPDAAAAVRGDGAAVVPVTDTLQQLGSSALHLLESAAGAAGEDVGALLDPVKRFLQWLSAPPGAAGAEGERAIAAAAALSAAAPAARPVAGSAAAAPNTPAAPGATGPAGLRALISVGAGEELGAAAEALLEALLAWVAALQGKSDRLVAELLSGERQFSPVVQLVQATLRGKAAALKGALIISGDATATADIDAAVEGFRASSQRLAERVVAGSIPIPAAVERLLELLYEHARELEVAALHSSIEQSIYSVSGKSKDIKASVKAGRKSTDEVAAEAVATLKQRAAALKKSVGSSSPEVAAAVDEVVAAFEVFAKALTAEVSAGKVESGAAVDEVMVQLEKAGKELQKLAAKGGMDKAVQDLTGRGPELKAAVSSGKANAADVVDDAVRTMKRKAEALKKTSANPEVTAAADAAVADLTKKADAMKKALAAGKTDAGHAIDDTLASVAQAAESLNHSSQSAGVGEAVKGMTGKSKDIKASVKAGRKSTDEVAAEAVATLKQRAAALKKSVGSSSPEVAAAVDEAVAAFEVFAKALTAEVSAGKVESGAAVDEVMAQLEKAGKELQKLAAKGGMDKAVQDLTGRGPELKAAVSSGKANAADVVDDAVRTMKRRAEALKRVAGGDKQALAAINGALSTFTAAAVQISADSSPDAMDKLGEAVKVAATDMKKGADASQKLRSSLQVTCASGNEVASVIKQVKDTAKGIKGDLGSRAEPQAEEALDRVANVAVVQLDALCQTGAGCQDPGIAAALQDAATAARQAASALKGQVAAGDKTLAAALDELPSQLADVIADRHDSAAIAAGARQAGLTVEQFASKYYAELSRGRADINWHRVLVLAVLALTLMKGGKATKGTVSGGGGGLFGLFGGSGSGATVDATLPSGSASLSADVKLPKVKGGKADVSVSVPDVELPKVKGGKADVSVPDVSVNASGGGGGLFGLFGGSGSGASGDATLPSGSASLSADVKLPKVKGGKVEVSVPDVGVNASGGGGGGLFGLFGISNGSKGTGRDSLFDPLDFATTAGSGCCTVGLLGSSRAASSPAPGPSASRVLAALDGSMASSSGSADSGSTKAAGSGKCRDGGKSERKGHGLWGLIIALASAALVRAFT